MKFLKMETYNAVVILSFRRKQSGLGDRITTALLYYLKWVLCFIGKFKSKNIRNI